MRWVEGFAERHGPLTVSVGAQSVTLAAASASAVLEVPWPPWQPPPSTDAGFVAGVLARHAARPRDLAILLVRRGGWAMGISRDGALDIHKTGKRYVQGQTAAGGWSQQRYARRRSNQADALVDAVVTAALTRILPPASAAAQSNPLDGLILGGDRPLLDAALADPRMRPLAALPRSPLLAIADPNADILAQAANRGRVIRIKLDQG